MAVGIAVSGLVALGFLALDGRHALAAAIGGAAMAAGNALSIALAFGGGIQRAPVALALAAWRLPPLPLLAGLAAGTLGYLLALNRTGARAGRNEQG